MAHAMPKSTSHPVVTTSDWTAADARYMAQAIRLAERGLNTTDPNPRVGCVITATNVNTNTATIIGQGWHQRAGEAHAEVNAIRDAAANGESLAGATAYVTLEPCSHQGRTGPCADALVKAEVGRVVVAMQDPNPQVAGNGIDKLRAAGIKVDIGLLQAEAEALNPGFIKRMRSGLPYVRVKLASSLDGRTALANGESQWITGTAARQDVQQWRARSSAIVTGVGTVLADQPSLNVRLPNTERQPMRVVLDSTLKTPANATILSLPGEAKLLYSQSSPSGHRVDDYAVEHLQLLPDLQPRTVLQWLAEQEINEVWVEAGATLAGSFIESGLVDELLLYQAPCLLGHEGQPLAKLTGIDTMDKRSDWQIQQVRQIGDDVRMILRPVQSIPA